MNNIIIYSTPSWPWCTKVKDYLSQKNITYTDYDVSKNYDKAVEMVQKSGQRGVPVIDINGQIIVGFDKASIDKILGL